MNLFEIVVLLSGLVATIQLVGIKYGVEDWVNNRFTRIRYCFLCVSFHLGWILYLIGSLWAWDFVFGDMILTILAIPSVSMVIVTRAQF